MAVLPSGLRGLAVSPGIAEGTGRIIRSIEDAKRIVRGEIAILRTDWTPDMTEVLIRCAGVVGILGRVSGGKTSHLAVQSRGLKIPAVTMIEDDTEDNIKDGDFLTVDGSSWIVHVNSRVDHT
jgi:phosphoenolpyruvate synthase/pyruvate phosphate dikinase